jgi:hypothetical protein
VSVGVWWLLYTIAGVGVVVWSYPRWLREMTQLERDVFAAHPPARALLALFLWVFWPLGFLVEVADLIHAAAYGVYNVWVDAANRFDDWREKREAGKP